MIQANSLHIPLKDESVQCVVTSPAYWGLRDYGTATWEGGKAGCDHKQETPKTRDFYNRRGETKVDGYAGSSCTSWAHRDMTVKAGNVCGKCGAKRIDNQLGLEVTPELYVENTVKWAREVWRILRNDGCFFLNLGDSYFSSLQSSDKFLIFREDLNEGELYESAMAVRRYMPGLWEAIWREEGKSEGNVCELLSKEIQKGKPGTSPGEPAEILSSESVKIYDQNKKEISGKKRESHSGNGREMRVLWRNGEDVSLLRPYKGRISRDCRYGLVAANLFRKKSLCWCHWKDSWSTSTNGKSIYQKEEASGEAINCLFLWGLGKVESSVVEIYLCIDFTLSLTEQLSNQNSMHKIHPLNENNTTFVL